MVTSITTNWLTEANLTAMLQVSVQLLQSSQEAALSGIAQSMAARGMAGLDPGLALAHQLDAAQRAALARAPLEQLFKLQELNSQVMVQELRNAGDLAAIDEKAVKDLDLFNRRMTKYDAAYTLWSALVRELAAHNVTMFDEVKVMEGVDGTSDPSAVSVSAAAMREATAAAIKPVGLPPFPNIPG